MSRTFKLVERGVYEKYKISTKPSETPVFAVEARQGKSRGYVLLLLWIIEFGVRFLLGFGFLGLPEGYVDAGNIGLI